MLSQLEDHHHYWHFFIKVLSVHHPLGLTAVNDNSVREAKVTSVREVNVNSYLSIRMHSVYEFCMRTHIYIQQECRSVLVELHPITFCRTVFLESAWFLGWMPLFLFFGLPIVSCSMINSLILGCLWPLLLVLNNILILGIWHSTISQLPGCFCPWTFFQNIGFNIGPLYVTSSNSTWIFCRGVSGFTTDSHCGVWCRGLTTCLLHVWNWLFNNSWAVGLT